MVTSGRATPSASCRKACGYDRPALAPGPWGKRNATNWDVLPPCGQAAAFGLGLGPAQTADALYDVKPGEVAGKLGSIIRVWPLEGGARRGRCLPHSLPLDLAEFSAIENAEKPLNRIQFLKA